MTENKSSVIDHARLEATARALRTHAGDFDVTAECNAVLEAFDNEIKEGTSATDFGIWEEPCANLVRWLALIQEKVAEVGQGMLDDATWLEDFSKKARNIQDGAATQAQSLGGDLGALGIGGGSPSPSKPSTFDPRTFRDVTPSITVPTVPTVPTPSTPAAPESTTPTPQGNTEEAAPPTAPKTTNMQEAVPTPQSAQSAPTAPQSNAEETAPAPDPQRGGNAVET